MHLKKLYLEQFRSHQGFSLDFPAKSLTTYIVGSNASGKTNILEAIYLLSLTRSFRTSAQEDMINWLGDYARVRGEIVDFEADNEEHIELEVFLGRFPQPRKALKKNGVRISAENFIGNLPVVFFHPEDLNLLYLGPDLRRRYLDILNIQVSRDYYRSLRKYKKLLEQRNALLKEIKFGQASSGDLPVWDEQLAIAGSMLINHRSKAVVYMNGIINEIYQSIANQPDQLTVIYRSSAFAELTGVNGSSITPAEYLRTLQSYYQRDLQAEVTTIGPHRDDIEFMLGRRPLAAHASRGEYRSLLLALKLIEIRFIETASGRRPLLLLDDVFSELDLTRQKSLMKAIIGHQTVITATHLDDSSKTAVSGQIITLK